MDQFMGSEEAVAGLMDMRFGQATSHTQLTQARRIGNITVTSNQIHELFQQYATLLV